MDVHYTVDYFVRAIFAAHYVIDGNGNTAAWRMIQRYNESLKACSYCLKAGHSAFQCPAKPRKPLQAKTAMARGTSTLKTTTKLKLVGKQGKRTAAAVAKWKRQQPTNSRGEYTCHYCLASVPYLMAEHKESKARRPDLRTNHDNLVPTCSSCNSQKMSKSHDEFCKRCL